MDDEEVLRCFFLLFWMFTIKCISLFLFFHIIQITHKLSMNISVPVPTPNSDKLKGVKMSFFLVTFGGQIRIESWFAQSINETVDTATAEIHKWNIRAGAVINMLISNECGPISAPPISFFASHASAKANTTENGNRNSKNNQNSTGYWNFMHELFALGGPLYAIRSLSHLSQSAAYDDDANNIFFSLHNSQFRCDTITIHAPQCHRRRRSRRRHSQNQRIKFKL